MTKINKIPDEALTGSLREYKLPEGQHLIERVKDFYGWQNLRREHNLWPYAKSTSSAPRTHTTALTDAGQKLAGVNFASQDYLSLASHPAIKEAATKQVGPLVSQLFKVLFAQTTMLLWMFLHTRVCKKVHVPPRKTFTSMVT